MPGKRITAQAHAEIRKAGGEDFIFDEVATGRSLKDIAQTLGVSRPVLSAWCNAAPRRDAYTRARRAAADALVEDGLTIADRARDPTDVPAAKLRSDYRKWMASRLDPQSWAESRAPLVSIDLAKLHLGALRQIHVVEGKSDNEPDGD